ncbi:DUF4112 domain-containing protein [Thalassobaculum sp.]|uniref:DUF4112 domain-containing protein n=1 Tax=Thalassobaculum sp. TaxID=2022740 RepID=UPI0032EB97E7
MSTGEKRLADIELLTRLLDDRFRIPGTSIRFGLDGVVGLVPGLGDAASMLASLYIIYRARGLGASNPVILRMIGNVLIDTAVGAVPVLGDLFDVAFKANRRNLTLLHRHLGSRADAHRLRPPGR